MSDLQRELETFKKELPRLLGESGAQGKFALIIGDEVLGTFESYADALQAGYQRAGLTDTFLVKKISTAETVAYFSRDLACPA